MRKLLFLTVAVCLFSIVGLAQDKKADYSGTWTLDVSKSKLDERSRIESQTLTVTQTDKEIKVATATKRLPTPADAPQGGGRPGGGGGMGGGDSRRTYALDGKETTIEQETPRGNVPVKLTAKSDAGKLHLASSRTMNTQMGEMTMTTKETWELSADGKTLTVNRESTSPRGTNSSTMVFAKK